MLVDTMLVGSPIFCKIFCRYCRKEERAHHVMDELHFQYYFFRYLFALENNALSLSLSLPPPTCCCVLLSLFIWGAGGNGVEVRLMQVLEVIRLLATLKVKTCFLSYKLFYSIYILVHVLAW